MPSTESIAETGDECVRYPAADATQTRIAAVSSMTNLFTSVVKRRLGVAADANNTPAWNTGGNYLHISLREPFSLQHETGASVWRFGAILERSEAEDG